MPARSSRPGACANCSIPRATPTPRPCSARCRSSAARRGSWQSPACGKTTTSKLILLQESPTAGAIRFDGQDITELGGAELMRYRREVQVVFQDPYSSLSPRMRVGEIIAEPLQIHTDLNRQQQQERV